MTSPSKASHFSFNGTMAAMSWKTFCSKYRTRPSSTGKPPLKLRWNCIKFWPGKAVMQQISDICCITALPGQNLMQFQRSFNGGLPVELGRVRYFEQNVFHDIAAIVPLKLKWLALEGDVIKSPGRGA